MSTEAERVAYHEAAHVVAAALLFDRVYTIPPLRLAEPFCCSGTAARVIASEGLTGADVETVLLAGVEAEARIAGVKWPSPVPADHAPGTSPSVARRFVEDNRQAINEVAAWLLKEGTAHYHTLRQILQPFLPRRASDRDASKVRRVVRL